MPSLTLISMYGWYGKVALKRPPLSSIKYKFKAEYMRPDSLLRETELEYL